MTTPATSPTESFQGLRRRDYIVRYANVALWSALTVYQAAATLKGLHVGNAGPAKPIDPVDPFISGIGALASGAAAYGWMRTCDAFNALRDGNRQRASQRAVDNRSAIGGITADLNYLWAGASFMVTSQMMPQTSTTQTLVAAALAAVFTFAGRVTGRDQMKKLDHETGFRRSGQRIVLRENAPRAPRT